MHLFNEYHAVDRACKNFISKLIPDKFYKSLSSRIIGFAKVTSLEILTHLITEYVEFEEEDIQETGWKIKEPISGETLYEKFVETIEWNKEALAVQNPYSLAQIVSVAYANIGLLAPLEGAPKYEYMKNLNVYLNSCSSSVD